MDCKDIPFTLSYIKHTVATKLEKEMVTHSSVLSWGIAGMGEPGGLPSMGLHRFGHNWSDLAAAAAAAAGLIWGFPGSSTGKEPTCNTGDPGLIPGSGSSSGEGIDNPLQYSCLENLHGQMSLVGYSSWSR